MAIKTYNKEDLPTIEVFVYADGEIADPDLEPKNIPVSYDGYSVVLHMEDGTNISLWGTDMVYLIEHGDHIFLSSC